MPAEDASSECAPSSAPKRLGAVIAVGVVIILASSQTSAIVAATFGLILVLGGIIGLIALPLARSPAGKRFFASSPGRDGNPPPPGLPSYYADGTPYNPVRGPNPNAPPPGNTAK